MRVGFGSLLALIFLFTSLAILSFFLLSSVAIFDLLLGPLFSFLFSSFFIAFFIAISFFGVGGVLADVIDVFVLFFVANGVGHRSAVETATSVGKVAVCCLGIGLQRVRA